MREHGTRKTTLRTSANFPGSSAGNALNILDSLLKAGANPAIVIGEGPQAGCDAMSFALELDYYPVFEYLVRRGGSPNSTGSITRITPLQYAVQNDDRVMVRYLLQKGAQLPPELLQQVYSENLRDVLKTHAPSQ